MQNNIKYLVILAMFVGITSLILFSDAKGNNEDIRLPYTKITPIIDGKFTSEKEWSDAKTVDFQSNGYNFYLQAKQDKDFFYLMFDGVDFQTNPKDNSTSVRYQAVVCLDDNANRPTQKQTGIICLISTENNEFGDHAQTTNSIQTYTETGKSQIIDDPAGYNSVWGFGGKDDPFEETEHLTYEVVIPKKIIKSDYPRFGFSIYFGSAPDDLIQLTDGVIWPPDSNKDDPSTWGNMVFLPKPLTPKQQMQAGVLDTDVHCETGLELVFKGSDNSAACVKPQTKSKLAERGWIKPKQMASDISYETMSRLAALLEGGQVQDFNEFHKGIAGRILLEKVDAQRAALVGINLEHVALPGAILMNVNLKDANLRNADLSNANLQGANLENIDSYRTKFWGANLHGVNLKNAKLDEVYFKSTDLSDANLQGATFSESVDMPITVNLQNTDLRGTKNLPITTQEAKERGAIVTEIKKEY